MQDQSARAPSKGRAPRARPWLLAVALLASACGGPADLAPGPMPASLVMSEDGLLRGAVRASDLQGRALEYAVASPPAHGALSLDAATGEFTYRPDADWTGVDSFRFTASAGGKASSPTPVEIAVVPVNDAPRVVLSGAAEPPAGARASAVGPAVALALALLEDGEASGRVEAVDPEGDPVAYRVVQPPGHGVLDLDPATGAFTFRPDPDWNGSDSFGFAASDGAATSAPATVALVVEAVNDAPVTSDLGLTLDEDGEAAGVVAGSDVDGPALGFRLAREPLHGVVQLDPATGSFTYSPERDWNGTDSFQVAVSDGQLQAHSTVTLEVRPVNDAPVAEPLSFRVDEDVAWAGAVRGGDADGDPLTFLLVEPPAHGTLDLDPGTGSFVYRGDRDWYGTDAFRVAAFDGIDRSDPVAVAVEVLPVNDAPAAEPQALRVPEDGVLAGRVGGRDVEGDPLGFALVAGPSHGTLSFDPVTGAFTYRPAPDWNGQDAFTFTASDGLLASAPAAVAIEVLPVNDRPVARSQALEVLEDLPLAGTVEATDVDGDTLAYSVALPPRHGTLTLDAATGAFAYQPDADYAGSDAFRFRASDGQLSAVGAVLLTVLPAADPPVALPQALTVGSGGAIAGVLWGEDPDGDALGYALESPPAHGTLTLDASGRTFLYRPAPGYAGADAFTFTTSDGTSVSAPGTVAIQVLAAAGVAPQILLQSGQPEVVVGQRAELGVSVAGTEAFRFKWWRNGAQIAGADGPRYVLPPATAEDDGATIAVTFYDRRTSVTSLSWTLSVSEARPEQRLVSLHANELELFPRREALAVTGIARPASGIGATLTLLAEGGTPEVSMSGAGAVSTDPATGALTVSFGDTGQPELQTASLDLRVAGTAESWALQLRFENAGWVAQEGEAGPARVTVTRMDVPMASTRVEDWLIGVPTAADVAFAQATWGGAVAGEATPAAKARALARAIIDAVEPHRGIPSDLVNRSTPFQQYQLALGGQGQLWCANIAAIFTHAAKSLGIPARIAALGRTTALTADYRVQTAESHATTEIFDAGLNRWVWIDLTLYLLGMERSDGSPLDLVEVQQGINDPGQAPFIRVREYDPATRAETVRDAPRSAQRESLLRFLGPDTGISIPRNGLVLPREYTANEAALHPRQEPLALRRLEPLAGDYGLLLHLASSFRDLARFESRETWSSDGWPDRAVRASADGRVAVRFADPHAPVAQAKVVALRAVARSGATSPEIPVIVRFYPRELYAAAGQTLPGNLIFDAGGLPTVTTSVNDWVVDWPPLADVEYAEATWGPAAASAPAAAEKAQAVGAMLLRDLLPLQGAPSVRGGAPFDLLRQALAGAELVDPASFPAMLAHACNALGLPARTVELGRTVSEGSDYRILGAAPRSAVEVFDESRNRWIWLDPSFGLLGAELADDGLLSTAGLRRALSDPLLAARVALLRYDPALAAVVREPLAASPAGAALQGYFRTYPVLKYLRSEASSR